MKKSSVTKKVVRKTSPKNISRLHYYASLLEAILLFVVGIFATHFASKYANIHVSNHVEDIILSNTPVFDLEFIFVQGAIMIALFIVALCVRFRMAAPFTLKTLAFFMVVRAMFVSLTHIAPYPSKLAIESGLLSFLTSGNDLFFSGHTGFPFLMALIFWEHKYIRVFFLIASFVFGGVVLLSHLHYSIDVFSAFFITYSIYHIALKFFHKDHEFFVLDEASRKKDTIV